MKKLIISLVISSILSGCVSQGYTDAINKNNEIKNLIEDKTTFNPSPKVKRISSPPVNNDNYKPVNKISWLNKKVSIGVDGLPLSSVLSILMDGTGAGVIYDSGVNPNALISLNYVGSLKDTLDVLAAENDYAVKASENQLEVIGFVSETFPITLPSGVYSGQLGSQGTAVDSNGGGAANGSPRVEGQFLNVAYESIDTFKEIEEGIKAILPKKAKDGEEESSVQVIPSLSIINVRTSPNRMKQVRNFVNAYTKQLEKQVILEVQIIEFNSNLGKEQGVDWNIARDTGNGIIKFFIPSTSKLSSSTGGGLAFEGVGKWDGTSALIKVLEQQGSVSTQTPVTGLVLHNQPSKISQSQTIPFISEIKTENQDGVVTAEYIRDKLSAGVDLMVTPNVQDDYVWLRISGKLNKVTNDETQEIGDAKLRFMSTQESEINFTNKLRYNQTYVIASVKQKNVMGKKNKNFWMDALGSQASNEETTETLVLLTPRRAE